MAPNATRIPFLAEALDINSARFVVGPILISRIRESKRAFSTVFFSRSDSSGPSYRQPSRFFYFVFGFALFLEAVGVRDDC